MWGGLIFKRNITTLKNTPTLSLRNHLSSLPMGVFSRNYGICLLCWFILWRCSSYTKFSPFPLSPSYLLCALFFPQLLPVHHSHSPFPFPLTLFWPSSLPLSYSFSIDFILAYKIEEVKGYDPEERKKKEEHEKKRRDFLKSCRNKGLQFEPEELPEELPEVCGSTSVCVVVCFTVYVCAWEAELSAMLELYIDYTGWFEWLYIYSHFKFSDIMVI